MVKTALPAANVRSVGDVHGSAVVSEPAGPELELGLEGTFDMVNETTFASG